MQETFRKSTILVVEPDSNILHVIRYHLGKAGFEVLCARDGTEALQILKNKPVELIVSDAAMSDMHGVALRKQLFLDPGTRDIPFLFLVSTVHPEQELPLLRNALDTWLAKPFDPLHLIARVESVLSRQRTHAELVRIDPLTRVFNLPTIEREVASDLHRIQRYERWATLVLIDIDNFGKLNEEFGFTFGDLLLSSLATIIVGNTRAADLVGRFSGGKFVLYFPETTAENSVPILERIQKQLKTVSIELVGREMTFSAGVVEIPKDGTELKVLYERVVSSLDLAKAQSESKIRIFKKEDFKAPFAG